jgi:hypothetical protein
MHVCKERNAHPHACVYVRLVAYSRRTRGVLAAYSRSGSLSFSAPSELVERPAPLSTPLRRTFFIHQGHSGRRKAAAKGLAGLAFIEKDSLVSLRDVYLRIALGTRRSSFPRFSNSWPSKAGHERRDKHFR